MVSTFALAIGLIVANLVRPGDGFNANPATLDTKGLQIHTSLDLDLQDQAQSALSTYVPATMAARADSISRRSQCTLWMVVSRATVGSETIRRWRR